ncbi:hypothetical protein P7M41_26165, partial [Vibrio parahaemolyticus]|nr:hypothetical protein [Vibrio parahaemolyticus]
RVHAHTQNSTRCMTVTLGATHEICSPLLIRAQNLAMLRWLKKAPPVPVGVGCDTWRWDDVSSVSAPVVS